MSDLTSLNYDCECRDNGLDFLFPILLLLLLSGGKHDCHDGGPDFIIIIIVLIFCGGNGFGYR